MQKPRIVKAWIIDSATIIGKDVEANFQPE
jgi:hypothetical protein